MSLLVVQPLEQESQTLNQLEVLLQALGLVQPLHKEAQPLELELVMHKPLEDLPLEQV